MIVGAFKLKSPKTKTAAAPSQHNISDEKGKSVATPSAGAAMSEGAGGTVATPSAEDAASE
eukprot:gene9140-10833_t